MDLRAEILHYRDLTEGDRACWARLQASDASLASPYFSAGYAGAADAARPGVRVMRFVHSAETLGFWAFRPGPLGTVRPVGGPMDDLHGIVAAPETALDLHHGDISCQLGGYAFSAVPASQRRHGIEGQSGAGNQVMDLSGGYDAWLADRNDNSSNFRREHRKVGKLLGDKATIVEHDIKDIGVLDRLIALKRAAYHQSGHFDLFSLEWPRALLTGLLERGAADARGVLSTLSIGGEVAAIAFCMRSQHVLHYWFPAYEEPFAAQKPGLALLFNLAQWAEGEGITELHLGLGETRYKRQMASWMAPVRCGSLALASPQKIATSCTAWSLNAEGSNRLLDLPAKYARKYDRAVLAGSWRA